jgi:hypothetical protein
MSPCCSAPRELRRRGSRALSTSAATPAGTLCPWTWLQLFREWPRRIYRGTRRITALRDKFLVLVGCPASSSRREAGRRYGSPSSSIQDTIRPMRALNHTQARRLIRSLSTGIRATAVIPYKTSVRRMGKGMLSLHSHTIWLQEELSQCCGQR